MPDALPTIPPRFLILGAMKSGTTSLHFALNRHPGVFIPPEETHFFTIDDHEQNIFYFADRKRWPDWDFEKNLSVYAEWYRRFFEEAKPGQLVGEDCTSYMPSRLAPQRIKKLIPDAKLIFMLRDPVSRMYSHYYHFVRSGRVSSSFEQTLRGCAHNIYQRSYYREHVENYLSVFDRSQCMFIIFEAFIKNPVPIIHQAAEFLGLDGYPEVSAGDMHQNSARVPWSIGLQLYLNRHFPGQLGLARHIARDLPSTHPIDPPTAALAVYTALGLGRGSRNRKYPRINPETKTFLQRVMAQRNRGLSELIGIDVSQYWPYMVD